MPHQTNVPAQTIFEEIQSISEFPELKLVRAITGVTDSDGNFVVPQQFKQFEIKDDMYDELLSPNPSWNSDKPGGTYFNDDLWHFIDMMR